MKLNISGITEETPDQKNCQCSLFKRLDMQTPELHKDKCTSTNEKSGVPKGWRCPQLSKLKEITDPFHSLEREYGKELEANSIDHDIEKILDLDLFLINLCQVEWWGKGKTYSNSF